MRFDRRILLFVFLHSAVDAAVVIPRFSNSTLPYSGTALSTASPSTANTLFPPAATGTAYTVLSGLPLPLAVPTAFARPLIFALDNPTNPTAIVGAVSQIVSAGESVISETSQASPNTMSASLPSDVNALSVLFSALPSEIASSIEEGYSTLTGLLPTPTKTSGISSLSQTSTPTTSPTTTSNPTTLATSASPTSLGATTSTTSTSPTLAPTAAPAQTDNQNSSSSSPSRGQIAGIATGSATAAILLTVALFYCLRRRRRNNKTLISRPRFLNNNGGNDNTAAHSAANENATSTDALNDTDASTEKSRSGASAGPLAFLTRLLSKSQPKSKRATPIYPEVAWLYDPVVTPPAQPSPTRAPVHEPWHPSVPQNPALSHPSQSSASTYSPPPHPQPAQGQLPSTRYQADPTPQPHTQFGRSVVDLRHGAGSTEPLLSSTARDANAPGQRGQRGPQGLGIQVAPFAGEAGRRGEVGRGEVGRHEAVSPAVSEVTALGSPGGGGGTGERDFAVFRGTGIGGAR